ncbi:MAG TPA: hypothetical protein VFV34_21010 [Blastocatellia bacterium]|nr:hypothetical protein [Blastocatellia bacterium]
MSVLDAGVTASITSAVVAVVAVMMAIKSGHEPDSIGGHDVQEPAIAPEFDLLRQRHAVALVGEEQEGTGIAKLPGGLFGFTYTPHQESPLFRNRTFRSFEVHKLADGSKHILGFVTEKDAVELADAKRDVAVKLYPEPIGDASRAACIPAGRIIHARGPARDDHNALALELAPLNEIAN